MAHKEETAQDQELDEDGLVVQKYVSIVLVVLPARDFDEQVLRYARSSLYNVHVGTRSVATVYDEPVHGHLQDEFLVDEPLEDQTLERYSGVIFAGGKGALELADHPTCQRLAREAAEAGKLIGAWDLSVAVPARAGVLRGRRVTGSPALAEELRRAGARYTGRPVEVDGTIVTAFDASAGVRFGKALVSVVAV